MNFSGIVLGLVAFLCIGFFHPLVIKGEYYFGTKCWWVFALAGVSQRNILHYIPRKKTPYIIYTRERQEKERLHIGREVYEERKESYTNRIHAMIDYATAEEQCRSRILLRYFGEKNRHNCGHCDACLKKHATGIKLGEFLDIKEEILQRLSQGPASMVRLTDEMEGDKDKIIHVLSFLSSEEIIQLEDGYLSIRN